MFIPDLLPNEYLACILLGFVVIYIPPTNQFTEFTEFCLVKQATSAEEICYFIAVHRGGHYAIDLAQKAGMWQESPPGRLSSLFQEPLCLADWYFSTPIRSARGDGWWHVLANISVLPGPGQVHTYPASRLPVVINVSKTDQLMMWHLLCTFATDRHFFKSKGLQHLFANYRTVCLHEVVHILPILPVPDEKLQSLERARFNLLATFLTVDRCSVLQEERQTTKIVCLHLVLHVEDLTGAQL